MKSSVPLHALIVAVTTLGAICVVACTETQSTEGQTVAGPAAGGPRVTQTKDESAGSPQSASKCEELGTLDATSLTGRQLSSKTQFTAFNLPNRPVISKVKVLAVGAASDLQGKSAVLGADVNNTWKTCTHCVLISIGCPSETDCAGAAFFFPRRGTATFSAVASTSGQPFAGTIDDVELEQVTIDPDTLVSTPVLNGACMYVKKLTFASTTLSATTPDDAGGSSTSTSSTSGSGLDSGKTSTSGGGTQPALLDGGKTSTSSGGTDDPMDFSGKTSTSSGGTQG